MPINSATPRIEDAFVYSCSFEKERGLEPFVSENHLTYQISGETHVYYQGRTLILKKGQLLLARKNQLVNSLKVPVTDSEYKAISLILSKERLEKYALVNNISSDQKYHGDGMVVLETDSFFTTYFSSLVPYVERAQPLNDKLTWLKISEAIELILQRDHDLKNVLFDFGEPGKVDLREFMKNHFHYNTSVATFAKLTGRSLAGFKRDFTKTFNTSPGKWLLERRLLEAYRLIKQRKQNPAELCLDIGFENLSHFYRAFKQKFGATPKEIQNQLS